MTVERETSLSGQAASFLYHEANLLDNWRLEEWLKLFEPDGGTLYWVPEGWVPERLQEEEDSDLHTSIIRDDYRRLQERVWRLVKGPAHSQIPRSCTSRIIGNIVAHQESDATILVMSNFIIHEVRSQGQRCFPGHYEHKLREVEGEWRLTSKKASLLGANLPLFNVTFMI